MFSYEYIDEAEGLLFQRIGCFDTVGHCVDYYHRDSHTTQRYHFEYDSLGRRIEETCYLDTAGTPYDSLHTLYTQTTYKYNHSGHRCSARIQGSNGRKYTFRLRYNEQGQLTKYIFPDGSRFSYEYDADGRLAKRINPDASIKEYTAAELPQPLVIDSLGRVLEAYVSDSTDHLVMVYYSYDDHNNWVRRTTSGDHSPSKLEVRTFEYYE